MKELQRKFLLGCLDSIDTIISDEQKLNASTLIYSQGNENDPRYQLQSKITEAELWSSKEKIEISSAVFEAIAHNSYLFCAAEKHTKDIEEATALFLNDYLLLITKNTEPSNRLPSVKKNIAELKLKIEQEIAAIEEQEDFSIKNNPFVFFSAVTAVAVGVAAVAALTLTP
ncbi:hypothetical protein [Legionella maioricensis]|uniref:Uncharacterized protein n=1 Tax=Legionella maioricensis TaxID=2896528 RepID=A0A9X2ID22_9GAMM|nr:hypothetical protein [Legionella maioricensis]MCL9685087.1 hypothetical protein [Legionella maioricensis]MCL9688152.1 hypothetical protein [Legionella maioricensis]